MDAENLGKVFAPCFIWPHGTQIPQPKEYEQLAILVQLMINHANEIVVSGSSSRNIDVPHKIAISADVTPIAGKSHLSKVTRRNQNGASSSLMNSYGFGSVPDLRQHRDKRDGLNSHARRSPSGELIQTKPSDFDVLQTLSLPRLSTHFEENGIIDEIMNKHD